MSTKAIFTLLTNQGIQDSLILASENLKNRLNQIREEKTRTITEPEQIKIKTLKKGLASNLEKINEIRANTGYTLPELAAIDPLNVPTRNDSDRYRSLYNKHVKNEDWQFLISQRIDLLNSLQDTQQELKNKIVNNDDIQPSLNDISKSHLNFLHKNFKPYVATSFEYTANDPVGSIYDFDQIYKYKIKNVGNFTHDQVLHVRLTGLKSNNPDDKVRYCDLLGHRLIEYCKITCNKVVLDEYTSERYNNYYNFELPTNKRSGWLRSIGHELPKAGYVTSDSSFQFSEMRYILDGPQTLKTEHNEVDIFIPLLFWYNLDIGLSLPNHIIPSGQLEIEIKFADVSKICASDNASGLNVGFTKPKIQIARMYSNNIWINPEIEDILVTKPTFTLIRVHKQLRKVVEKPTDELHLFELKWPIERMYFGFRPVVNENGDSNMDLWHRNSKITVNDIPTAGITLDTAVIPNQYIPAVSFIRHYSEQPSVNNLTLSAHGIKMYDDYPSNIFNSYFPFKFGSLNSPIESGLYMINFDLVPGTYQPSGYFNNSKAREFYIKYLSNAIDINNPAYFHLTAICINFLVVKDGNAYLKFST